VGVSRMEEGASVGRMDCRLLGLLEVTDAGKRVAIGRGKESARLSGRKARLRHHSPPRQSRSAQPTTRTIALVTGRIT
jgi:hypothetical protein